MTELEQGLRLYSEEYTQELFHSRMQAAVGPQYGQFVVAMVARKLRPLVARMHHQHGMVAVIGEENQGVCQGSHLQKIDLHLGLKLDLVPIEGEDGPEESVKAALADAGQHIQLLSGHNARGVFVEVMNAVGLRLSKEHESIMWQILDHLYREGFVMARYDGHNCRTLTEYFRDEDIVELHVRLRPAKPEKVETDGGD